MGYLKWDELLEEKVSTCPLPQLSPMKGLWVRVADFRVANEIWVDLKSKGHLALHSHGVASPKW
jgi:hypothetical protein